MERRTPAGSALHARAELRSARIKIIESSHRRIAASRTSSLGGMDAAAECRMGIAASRFILGQKHHPPQPSHPVADEPGFEDRHAAAYERYVAGYERTMARIKNRGSDQIRRVLQALLPMILGEYSWGMADALADQLPPLHGIALHDGI